MITKHRDTKKKPYQFGGIFLAAKIANSYQLPLAMSIGNAVLDLILKKGFLKNIQLVSQYFHSELHKLQSEFPSIIKEVRGVGLLIGIKKYLEDLLFCSVVPNFKLWCTGRDVRNLFIRHEFNKW